MDRGDGNGNARGGQAQELRVHGVGGSPGPAMLGVTSGDDTITVAEGIGTKFIARRSDLCVEGYDWGHLTSGSSLQALWVLLLPFTLLNVAGWMHPPPDSAFNHQIWAIRSIVRLLCLAMTVSYVLWIAVVLVDVVGYQWTRRLSELEWMRNRELFGWRAVSAGAVQPIQIVGMVMGGALTALAALGIDRIADNTQRKFERTPLSRFIELPDEAKRRTWKFGEDLTSRCFFAHAPAARQRLEHHRVAMVAAGVFVALQSVSQAGAGGADLSLGSGLVLMGGLEFVAVLLLGLVSFPTGGRSGADVVRSGPAIAAVLAFALAHAFFSGLILFAVKWLNGRPSLDDDGGGAAAVQGGPELALTDVWSVLVAVSVVYGCLWLRRQRKRGTASDLPPRNAGVGQPLDGVPEGLRRQVANARGYATAGHRAPQLITGVALAFFVVSAFFAVRRFDPGGTLDSRGWSLRFDAGGTLWSVAAWLLPATLLAAVATVRRATTSPTLRRSIGILWDVLTFWPRRFHPLAVRPYSERAVPEFQGRILEHVCNDGRPVVVSAHSQGSTLAFAALAPLDGESTLHSVALVTFGSPIGGLYAQLFPAYFGPAQVDALKAKLLGGEQAGWRNFYRRTDPIGVPLFHDPARDVELDDPAQASRLDEGPEVPPLERDRPAWSTVAGHSHYQREPLLKAWVRQLNDHLTQVAPPNPRSSSAVRPPDGA